MFCIDGTKRDAILALQRLGISTDHEAEVLLDFIHSNQYLLNENECIEIEDNYTYPQNQNMMGLVLCDSSYYINLKKTTIILAAFLLDIHLTKGLAATALSLFANVKKKLGQCSKKTRPPALLKNQATWPKIAIKKLYHLVTNAIKKVDHPGLFRSPGGVWIAMLGSICL